MPGLPALCAGALIALSGRGGEALPAGYLSTAGSRIVDQRGVTVRIAAVAWDGTSGPAGSAPHGLWAASYREILDSIREDGFNTVRIPWTDANLDARFANTEALGTIDFGKNPEFRGATTLQALHTIAAYAGCVGLKVIFDHHSNEGTSGQQRNGLWFDLGPGTDGTDGAGVRGTVTYSRFKANWVRLARAFADDPTVIGFDLHNEPLTHAGHVTWGGGGPTDLHHMCEDVGAAIQAVNPGPLIICEGPQNYTGNFAGTGVAPEGDLSLAGTIPVRLPVPNKVVYSVHEYPREIAAAGTDFGPAYVDRMTSAWGYLIGQNIAPVWIGEMGASMTSLASRRWAATLLGYMNGAYARWGGPRPCNPVSGSWWHAGEERDPQGTQTAWGRGHYRPQVQAVTDKMLFRSGAACVPEPVPAAVQ